jgi:hypothetical protein
MEDSTLPSVGASFKKWGCCAHTPQSSPGPCNMQRPLISKKKKFQIIIIFKKRGCRMTSDRPAVAQSGATSSRQPLLCGSPFIQPPCPLLPTSLPPNFSTCGQVFLIGSSTCPPCPDFS